MKLLKTAGSLIVLFTTHVALSAVKMPALFSSGMVLQRDKPVPFWGTADPGESITVTVAGQSQTALADADGKWKVTLTPLHAGGPDIIDVHGKSDHLTFSDVLVGEVWLCSGQSNMELPITRTANFEQTLAAASNPNLRLFTVQKHASDDVQADYAGKWQPSRSETVAPFSAIGYYFGQKLQHDLNVPVGLIESSVGGTPIEAWTSKPVLKTADNADAIFARDKRDRESAPADRKRIDADMEKWRADAKAAEANHQPPPVRPHNPASLNETTYAGRLYNGMIAPLAPYALRGTIWLQGEANVSRGAKAYRNLLELMIRSWRADWADPTMPFGIVQISNYQSIQTDPNEISARAELREAQSKTAEALDHTGLVVTMDLGEVDNIHYPRKQPAGERLALWALATAYGRDVAYAGPQFTSMQIEGNKARVKFAHADGLHADGEALKGFVVAGEDHKFFFANAKIDNDAVLLWSDQVIQPVAVRYDFANNPTGNLYNAAKLPACPFRTDDWPGARVANP